MQVPRLRRRKTEQLCTRTTSLCIVLLTRAVETSGAHLTHGSACCNLAAEAPRAAKHVNGDVMPMSLVFLPMTTSEQLVQSKLPAELWSSLAGMPRSRSALRCIRNQMRTYRNPQTQRPQTQRGQVRQGIVRVPTEPIIWARITLLTARADK